MIVNSNGTRLTITFSAPLLFQGATDLVRYRVQPGAEAVPVAAKLATLLYTTYESGVGFVGRPTGDAAVMFVEATSGFSANATLEPSVKISAGALVSASPKMLLQGQVGMMGGASVSVRAIPSASMHGSAGFDADLQFIQPANTRLFYPLGVSIPFVVGDYITLSSAYDSLPFLKVVALALDGGLILDREFPFPEDSPLTWTHTSALQGVELEINKPTNGKTYTMFVEGLRTEAGAPYNDSSSFAAVSSKPAVVSAEELDEAQVLITFSDTMRIDAALLSPAEYAVTGPTNVLVKTAQTVAKNQVLLTTVGMGAGSYTLEVNASGTPHDVAGNPIDPTFNQATFTGSAALASRSVFTDHGPITKPVEVLQSGATATITTQTQISLPGAALLPQHVGLYLTITGTLNSGTYRIVALVSATVARVDASFSLPDVSNGSIGWSLRDQHNGEIADDPSDVVVRVNGVPVTADSVIGLLGQVVLPTVPGANDTVDIDYSWVNNPVVDFRRLNSREFRLNNWNRDNNRPTDTSRHKYRYNNTLIEPTTFVALDMRADLDQPQVRDLKYRAYERAYSVALNDPNLLLLNSPNHRIAFPPMTRTLESTFVNYQATVLPESDTTDPWVRHGSGLASIVGTDLQVVDNTTGPFPGGEPIFWSNEIDLTFQHVFAIAWRMKVDANPIMDGVFTGVAAGYSDESKAVVIGFLEDAGVKKFGVLRTGFGNDPSSSTAWAGALDITGSPTGFPADLDWSIIRSYRIFRDRVGTISVYVDGSVIPTLQVTAADLPYLEELNAPFNQLQGAFFGSLSREAENTSSWSFVRYSAIPINPLQTAPSIFVSYEGTTPPESASQPWTPVGFHGTETIQGGVSLLLDSTSATDPGTEASAGLISGDFRGYTRIEPLLAKSFDTVLDIDVAVRTYTHGITPNAVMAAIDDGTRLIQLSFFADTAAPKFSYGGRSLPPDFAPYLWGQSGGATAAMIGQYLRITDASNSDGLVYFLEDNAIVASAARVVGFSNDYILEFRAQVESFTPDIVGFAGVMSSVYDSQRSVGMQLTEVAGVRYVEFHSEGAPVAGGQFAFEWDDNAFHTYRAIKSTGGNLVSLFIDGTFIGSTPYSNFLVTAPSITGMVSFGSATPLSVQAMSSVVWAYSNFWRVNQPRKFVGLWRGYDSNALTGYHLPLRARGRQAAVNGNSLVDTSANFVTSGVQIGDQLIVDDGLNKGVYTVASVAFTALTVSPMFPFQPTAVDYRIAVEMDWSSQHKYRIVKDPTGGVAVFLDAVTAPLIHIDYSSLDLPVSSVGVPRVISGGLPSIVWGAFDPTNLSQTAWDFVRFGAVRSLSEMGIVPHHQILNQRNIMASFEHHRTNIPHTHTDFWSESEGIPPQTEPDLLRDPNLVAFTLLNDSTPLVPSTQTYEVRRPTPVLVPVSGLNSPEDVLNSQAFLLNNAEQRIEIVVPDDVLYNSLQVIESTAGATGILAPIDDDEPNFWPSDSPLSYQKTVCLTYDGTTLPENDATAATPWTRVSDDPTHQFASTFSGVLTYGTDVVGTRTTYRNNTPLPDAISLQTEVKFRLKILQDSTGGLGDSQVRVGFSSPGATVGLAFITSPIGERYVLAVDMNNGQTVGGIPFDFYDGSYHNYRLVRDPGSATIQIFIDA